MYAAVQHSSPPKKLGKVGCIQEASHNVHECPPGSLADSILLRSVRSSELLNDSHSLAVLGEIECRVLPGAVGVKCSNPESMGNGNVLVEPHQRVQGFILGLDEVDDIHPRVYIREFAHIGKPAFGSRCDGAN